MITKQQLADAAREALANWDGDLMEPGQSQVLEAIATKPHNFSDNDGMVEIPEGWDVWKYLEEVSVSNA
jgi:hypothetical protein